MKLLVDVHAHLDFAIMMKDIDGVISRAKEAGVKTIITSGLNKSTNRAALELAKKYDIVKAALGIYPVDGVANLIDLSEHPHAERFDVDEEIAFIEKQKNNIVAIGEIGLDALEAKDYLPQQKIVFERLLALAEKLHKPVVVHSRKAELETVEVLESTKLKNVVMHCFCGKLKLAKRIADNGWRLSIPPSVVYNQSFQRLVEEVPSTALLTETDAPFQGPFRDKTYKEQINEPAFIVETIKKIAELKKMDVEETEKVIFMNYRNVFY